MGAADSVRSESRNRATSVRRFKHFALTIWIFVSVQVIGVSNAKAFIPIYAGGAYDAQASIGYRDPDGIGSYYPYPVDQGATVGEGGKMVAAVNDSGVTIAVADKFDQANFPGEGWTVPLRWSASTSPVEMATLSHAATNYNGATPLAMNNSGVAVGQAYTFSAGHNVFDGRPVRWSANGLTATELGTFGTDSDGRATGAAYGVNAGGTAVGFSKVYNTSHDYQYFIATRWDAGSTTPTALVAGAFSSAYAINDSGTAVGYTTVTDQGQFEGWRATRWAPAPSTQLTLLGALGSSADVFGVNSSYAFDINSAGTAVGISDKYDASHTFLGMRAVRWNANTTAPTELGTIGAAGPPSFAINFAYAVNTEGTSVGLASKYDAGASPLGIRPVRWNAGATAATELGILGTSTSGQTDGSANDVNDGGFAVGRLVNYNADGLYAAVYWRPDGSVVDLNSLIDPSSGWQLAEARHISNTGWVTGWGYYTAQGSNTPYTRAFLLQLPPDADYSHNGIVDAADYILWRSTFGQSVAIGSGADGNRDGQVTQADYDLWRSQLGQTNPGTGAVLAAVPEPSSCILGVFLLAAAAAVRRLAVARH